MSFFRFIKLHIGTLPFLYDLDWRLKQTILRMQVRRHGSLSRQARQEALMVSEDGGRNRETERDRQDVVVVKEFQQQCIFSQPTHLW